MRKYLVAVSNNGRISKRLIPAKNELDVREKCGESYVSCIPYQGKIANEYIESCRPKNIFDSSMEGLYGGVSKYGRRNCKKTG